MKQKETLEKTVEQDQADPRADLRTAVWIHNPACPQSGPSRQSTPCCCCVYSDVLVLRNTRFTPVNQTKRCSDLRAEIHNKNPLNLSLDVMRSSVERKAETHPPIYSWFLLFVVGAPRVKTTVVSRYEVRQALPFSFIIHTYLSRRKQITHETFFSRNFDSAASFFFPAQPPSDPSSLQETTDTHRYHQPIESP